MTSCAKPLRERIVGALRLQPMTAAQLSTCLSECHWAVRRLLAEMHADGVLAPAGFRNRQQLHALSNIAKAAA